MPRFGADTSARLARSAGVGPRVIPQTFGRFRIRGELGSGAFATVYRAYDPRLEREVALKVLRAGVLDDPAVTERFLREAKAAANLRHPAIVAVFEAGQVGAGYYIASEFVAGFALSASVPLGGMDVRRAATIVRDLAEAVGYAHQRGVVHRDIKPANVILDADDRPHLLDFGLAARREGDEKLTTDGAVLGTPAYMAPEQAGGQIGEAKPAADQYSLGVLLYELLTGRVPFAGPATIVLFHHLHTDPEPPRKLRPRIPPRLEAICLRAMAKGAGERYPTVSELAAALTAYLAGDGPKERPAPPRRSRYRTAAVYLWGAAACAVAAFYCGGCAGSGAAGTDRGPGVTEPGSPAPAPEAGPGRAEGRGPPPRPDPATGAPVPGPPRRPLPLTH
jgi:serine/threonine protein kinase